MKRKIRLLYVSAEIAPYANAGGLGEVGRSFPQILQDTGEYEVLRVMPLYKKVAVQLDYVADFRVRMDQEYETCLIKKEVEQKEIPTYFIQNDRYFYRDNIYSYEDDGFRFFFFCSAVLEMLKVIPFHPDIIQTNDWHTGFLPLLIKKEFPDIRTVYTIHNISYHGFIPAAYLHRQLSEEELERLGYPEWLNFMKAGILYSDLVTTVSPGYAKEILQPAMSAGVAPLLAARQDKPIGILNGIDLEQYDPANDGVLEFPYDISHPELKKKNRTLLRQEYHIPDEDKPLVAMVTRLDYYKGIDLVIKALSFLNLKSFQLIILGTGGTFYQGMLAGINSAYADNVVVDFNYTPDLAKKIYAAADIYLMPSLYEPCGLGQLYAMRYGTVPVVNPVGGLGDTVTDDPDPKRSTGFYMEEWSADALRRALQRAIEAYHTPDWSYYVKNAMSFDSSWEKSITLYQKYFNELLVLDTDQ